MIWGGGAEEIEDKTFRRPFSGEKKNWKGYCEEKNKFIFEYSSPPRSLMVDPKGSLVM